MYEAHLAQKSLSNQSVGQIYIGFLLKWADFVCKNVMNRSKPDCRIVMFSFYSNPFDWQIAGYYPDKLPATSYFYIDNFIYIYIYIYSFSRRFYPKRLTIEEYNKRYILKK